MGLNDLPKEIIAFILSFLPIKNAVANSVVSKTWLEAMPYLWTSPVNIRLVGKDLLNEGLLSTFLTNESRLGELGVNCKYEYGVFHIVDWVAASILKHVEKLILEIIINDSQPLFEVISGCQSLKSLKLLINCILNVPHGFNLPHLERLEISRGKISNGSLKVLIEGCALIEELKMCGCVIWNSGDLSAVNCCKIKKLVLKDNDVWSNLELHTPILETIIYEEKRKDCHYFIPMCGECLQTAIYDISRSCINSYASKNLESIETAIKSFRSTRKLYLSGFILTALYEMKFFYLTFENLKFLSLGLIRLESGWALFACILKSAPNLESVKLEEGVKHGADMFEKFIAYLLSKPSCMEMHLKQVEFGVFRVNQSEIKLVQYFLRYGRALETLKIHCLSCMAPKIKNFLDKNPNYSKVVFDCK